MPDYSQLSVLLPDVSVCILPETASTNSDARALLLRGGTHGSLVVAARQTGGRGRMGRAFCSEEGGLYMSLLLRGAWPAGQLTTLCAVAVCRAVERLTQLHLDIKWVNDAQLDGKKVCGILTEMNAQFDYINHIVVGIGINVHNESFPEHQPEPAQLSARACLYRALAVSKRRRALHARPAMRRRLS